MKNVSYLEILKQAFVISWKNKSLWVFGFFVLLGSFPSFNFNFTPDDEKGKKLESAIGFLGKHESLLIGIVLIGVLIIAGVVFLKIIGTAALTKASNNISVYGQSSIKSIFSESVEYFWKLFFMDLVIGLGLGIIAFILASPGIYILFFGEKTLGFFLLVVAIFIFIPLGIIAFFLKKFATFNIVLANMKTQVSLELAYQIFRKKLKESLIMAIVAIVMNMAVCILYIFCIISVAFIFILLGILFYLVFSKMGALIVAGIGVFVAVILFIIIYSWYSFFSQAAWVVFFQHMIFERKNEKGEIEKQEIKSEVASPEVI
jgi:hypothetical protein